MNALTTATLLAGIVLTQLLPVGISPAFETLEHCPRGDNYENHNQIDYGPLRVSGLEGVATIRSTRLFHLRASCSLRNEPTSLSLRREPMTAVGSVCRKSRMDATDSL